MADLIEIKNDIVTIKAELAQAKKDGNEALILANTNLLAELRRKENNLEAVVGISTMATHQCKKCLKKTNEDGNLTSSAWVAPDSVCNAAGSVSTHDWNPLVGKQKLYPIFVHMNCLLLSIDE